VEEGRRDEGVGCLGGGAERAGGRGEGEGGRGRGKSAPPPPFVQAEGIYNMHDEGRIHYLLKL